MQSKRRPFRQILPVATCQFSLGLYSICLLFLTLMPAAHGQVTYVPLQTAPVSGLTSPYSVALDGNGNLYIGDLSDGTVKEVLAVNGAIPASPVVKVLASGFKDVSGLAVDTSGNVFLTDGSANEVEEIEAVDGVIPSSNPTIRTLASGLSEPVGAAVDGSGNVYFCDRENSAVREILAVGGVIPASPTIRVLGSGFTTPEFTALDAEGDLFFVDDSKGYVEEMVAVNGSIPATNPTIRVLLTGVNDPGGIAVDLGGNVYISDYAALTVSELVAVNGTVPSSPTVISLGGGYLYPYGLAVNSHRDLFVADNSNYRIDELALQAVSFGSRAVSTPSSTISVPFTISAGKKVGSLFVVTNGTTSLDFASASTTTCNLGIYLNSASCHVDVTFTPTAAGTRQGAIVFYSGTRGTGSVEASVPIYGVGLGSQSVFGSGSPVAFDPSVNSLSLATPGGTAVDGNGNLYISDTGNNRIVEIPNPDTGAIVIAPTVDSLPLSSPEGLAVDGAGNLYIADTQNSRVVEVTPGGVATAITPTVNGSTLDSPYEVALDGAGDLFIADYSNARVVEVLPDGAGSIAIQPTVNGTTLSAPTGLAVDSSGNLFISDYQQNRVLEVPSNGAAPIEINPTVDGVPFTTPVGLAVDGAGDLYITELYSDMVIEVPAGGGNPFSISGLTGGENWSYPFSMAMDRLGNLYAADYSNNRVIEMVRGSVPTLGFNTSTLVGAADSTDGTMIVPFANIGNQTMALSSVNYPADFSAGAGAATQCESLLSIAPGGGCNLPIEFMPKSTGLLNESVVLNMNSATSTPSSTSVLVLGTGVAPATLTSPLPSTTLAGPKVTFSWTPVTNAAGYWLFLGTTGVGSKNLYDSGEITTTSATFSSLPLNGDTVYARVYTSYNGALEYNDYVYKAAKLAALTAPVPGGTLPGPSATFTWSSATGSGAQGYWLFLGTTGVGSKNLYDSGETTATSVTYSSLPLNGKTIYARVYTSYSGVLYSKDYTYIAAAQATLTSPTPGGTLPGPSATFSWTPATGSGNQGYWLFLGTTGAGSKNLYDSGEITTTSATVTNLPVTGATIYARVYISYNGTLVYSDYTYTAAKGAVLTTPAPGSTLGGSTITFDWNPATGSNVQGYWLFLGTSGAGSKNLYDSGETTALTKTVSNLPTTGGTIYARVYTSYNGTLTYNDYTYTEK